MPNIYKPNFDQERHAPEGFRALRALIGRQVEAKRLGLSLWELPPGEAAYPYHYHLADEELIVILEGYPTLRTADGWRELEEGEVVSFPIGAEGGHQLVNWTEERVRFLAFSPAGIPDTVIYPDSHKLGAAERRRGGYVIRVVYEDQMDVEYWRGERPPTRP